LIAAMVSALVLLILALALAWLLSPAFRHWTEQRKFQILERGALYERAHSPDNGLPAAEAATGLINLFSSIDPLIFDANLDVERICRE
jgi:hypothetical protein